MQALLDEIARMPDSALRFARNVSEVRTPEPLVEARRAFLTKHQGNLGVLFSALRDRFPEAGETINCFYAAADAALMAHVDPTLTPHDRILLRQLWEALLHAR
jgi:hypothetical protein